VRDEVVVGEVGLTRWQSMLLHVTSVRVER
jgi:hypothetical protein